MTNEFLYIGVLLITAGAVTWIYFPGSPFKRYLLKIRNTSNRARTEDALKHFFDCEERHLTGTSDSLAGFLNTSRDRAALVISRLQENKLIEAERDGIYRLSQQGRSYALRVIRTHRLWERYLADETGTDQMAWHYLAEKKEHQLSSDETDALAARLGNPMFDPHGDPIPMKDGEIPRRKGFTLSELPVMDTGQIIHIEDEPEIIYSQIVAVGLYSGMHVRMISSDSERIRFEANGEEIVLSPQIAGNITVSALGFNEFIPDEYISLASLKVGETCRVISIAKALRGQQRRRLMDLGVVPGSIIEVKFSSSSEDPRAYSIRGALIALRKEHASLIYVEKTGVKDNG
ncbi:MAG: hypothetical protein AMXMBFR48_03180 [Ignavibacteriales bacterium]